VFVTAFDQYAVQAFENEAVDYVLKPVSNERLTQTVNRLRNALLQSQPAPEIAQLLKLLSQHGQQRAVPQAGPLRWIRANRGDTTYQISVDEVSHFQSDDKYTVVNTANGEHLITKPLSELVQQLDAEQFWQVHRGTVVNVRYVISSKREAKGVWACNCVVWTDRSPYLAPTSTCSGRCNAEEKPSIGAHFQAFLPQNCPPIGEFDPLDFEDSGFAERCASGENAGLITSEGPCSLVLPSRVSRPLCWY
jgi:hypothetical protein